MGSSDEEYLDNLLKSISVGGTDSENDLDLLLSQLDQELDNQLQQQEGTAPVSDNMLDGLADFGMEEEMDAVTENELDGLADFGEEETENTLDGLADFGAESEGDDVPDDVSESEPDGIADFSMENDTDIDMENILDGLSDLSDEGENAEAAEEPLSFDSGMELDGLGDLFGEASGEETMELPEDDEDLAEINDLLRKSDNHELVDDDMYALLENMSEEDGGSTYQESESNDFDLFGMDYADGSIEISPEDMAELESIPEKPAKAQKEKKQKEKKVKEKKVKDKQAKGGLFAKKKSNDAEESAENVPEEGSKPETEKKKGLFGRFLDAITEEVDEEEDSKPKDENQAIG